MNISQRLRTCAKHTALDAVIELLNEAADEIDALHARANGQATQPAEVTDKQIKMLIPRGDAWKYEIGFPEAIKFARAILALRPVQVPMTDEVRERALDLLATLFDAYENGPACYESPDDCVGYLGNAVQIDHDTFHVIASLLNVHRPIISPGITAQAKKETP